jgi:hypothetical protein
MRLGAYREENAKTLAELGLSENRMAKKLLFSDSGALSKAVFRIGKPKPSYEEYMAQKAKIKAEKKKGSLVKEFYGLTDDEINNAKFYIPDQMREYAERTLRNNSSSFIKTALLCVLIFGFFAVLVFAMPSILDIINASLA